MCEGEVSEPAYVEGFRRLHRNPLVTVKVSGGHAQASVVVREAIKLKTVADEEARRGGAASPCNDNGVCDEGLTGSGSCDCFGGWSGRSCATWDEGPPP